ncbi:inositol 5-phosphatase [Xylariaceae sp. FL0804]|nr:inositol 5-phosphatase [Xylariaceae sp. FL0804]
MAPRAPTLDLFILTFNAAKQQINMPVFGNHLHDAFGKNATTLPELVVVCLQEVAPLAEAFVGSYMLSPYLQHFETAVNLAAAKFDVEDGPRSSPRDPPYTLVKASNVAMTAIMLFARQPAAIHNVQVAEVGFGAGDMANKGAVGLRLLYEKANDQGDMKETELTFVGTHLAAFEWNLERRNKNWENIVSDLLFEDPMKLSGHSSQSQPPTPQEAGQGGEGQALLAPASKQHAMQDISIYKRGTQLFVAGDLNYRISEASPAADSVFPDLDPESSRYFANFRGRDQLSVEQEAGRTLHGLSEAQIDFPPTYKLKVQPKSPSDAELDRMAVDEPEVDVVSWKWATHRWPSWCDRVLFLNIPWWAQALPEENKEIKVMAYDALPAVRTSDHRPVFLRLNVPVLDPYKLAPGDEACETELAPGRHTPANPMVKLPVSINVHAWEHRASVRKWESLAGWSMVVARSKQTIALAATVFIIAVGTWWMTSSTASPT